MNPESFTPSTAESVNLLKLRIKQAEKDAAFKYVASTYNLENNMIYDGDYYTGKKIVTFSNILNHETFPLANIISDLLEISSQAMNNHVEIEFAANLDTPPGQPMILNYLQVRPIVSTDNQLNAAIVEKDVEDSLLYSEKAMGNGIIKDIFDVIYIKPENFDPAKNPNIVLELDKLNEKFRKENRFYILIGPGRWGSSDPWLGIPVKWPQISSARIIIEAGLENYRVDPSQGTHFFHNLTSFGVGYFTINPYIKDGHFEYDYMDSFPALYESELVRHVRFEKEMLIKIDGRTNKGVILKPKL